MIKEWLMHMGQIVMFNMVVFFFVVIATKIIKYFIDEYYEERNKANRGE